MARLLARLAAGLIAIIVIVGPVVAVARAAGNPIPTDLLDRLGSRRVDDATIVKVLSLGFYVCWAWFCAPAVRQLMSGSSRQASTSPRRAPIAVGSADRSHKPRPVAPLGAGPRGLLARLARFAVSGAALAVTTAGPATTAATIASAPSAIVAVVGAAAAPDHADAAAPTRSALPATTSYLAAHRDTPYSVATKYFPADRVDEMRERIVELNVGRVLPDGSPYRGGGFPAGWSVLVPMDARAASVIEKPEPTATPAVPPGPWLPAATITVEAGDNLWALTEERLHAAGATVDDVSVAAHLEIVIAGNDAVIEDPDLIYPGERLDFPSIGAPTPSPGEPPAAEAPPAPPPADAAAVVEDSPSSPAVPASAPAEAAAAAEVAAPAEAAAPAASAAPTTTTPPPPTAPPDPAPMGARTTVTAPSPIGLGEAALLSAGVLALLASRRRLRLRASQPRARVPDSSPEAVAAERRLRTVDASERLLRVDVAVRAAAASLVDTSVQITVVRVAADGTVELALTGDAHLRAPWEGAGARWMLPASTPVELLSEAARAVGAPCVALTQLGVDGDGREVLVDLEALGVLSIAAPDGLADAVVRGIAATLATSVFAEVANLVGVAIDERAFLDHRQAHTVSTVDGALELAATLVGTTASAKQSTFVLRARHTSGEAWEPAVVLTGSAVASEVTAEVVRSATRRRGGVAVVVAGHAPDAPWTLRAEDGRWVLDPLGLTLVPVGLSARELDELHDVLHLAEAPLVDEEPLVPEAAGDETNVESPTDPTVDEVPDAPWALMVRLLGPVEVIDGDGRSATFERSKALELIAWLTLHRDRSTRAGARTALWELDVRDATFANVVSEARRAMARLVEPPADLEWLGRTLTEVLPLHDAVVTDVDVVRRRLDLARVQPPELAIETLRPAVELIRDLPFAGTGYLWPDAEGITSNLVLLATSAATELAGHFLSMGDIDGVFWATGQGLKVLPGHEELIALRMRAHARAGDLSGVRLEWESYERVLNADPWSDGEPAPKLVMLRRELLSG